MMVGGAIHDFLCARKTNAFLKLLAFSAVNNHFFKNTVQYPHSLEKFDELLHTQRVNFHRHAPQV
jgi:hypothetical protein